MRPPLTIATAFFTALTAAAPGAELTVPEKVEFNRDVRPILAVPSPEAAAQIAALQTEIEEARQAGAAEVEAPAAEALKKRLKELPESPSRAA